MESTSEKPDYYVVIPAHVRYCKVLKSNEKLIFGEITFLCNQKGYCWASNKYFSNLFQISNRTVSRYINNLKDHDFISVNIIRDASNMVVKRIIKIVNHDIYKAVYTLGQNCLTPIDKTVQYNNTSNNNKKEKDILFNKFWDAYAYKKSRKLCYYKFINLSLEICEKCVVAAKEYSDSINDKKFQKYPVTWLNHGCWDDEIIDNTDSKDWAKGTKLEGFVF